MLYAGIVTVNERTFQFRLENYKLYIFDYSSKRVAWNDICGLIEDYWIILEDATCNTLYVKIESAHLMSLFEYMFDALGVIIVGADSKRKIDNHNIIYNEISMQSDVLDCFFRNDYVHKQEIMSLLGRDQCIEVNGLDKKRPEITLSLDEIAYNARFTTSIQADRKTGIKQYNNVLILSANIINDVEQAWKIVRTVRIFLQFIAQAKFVNFSNPVRLIQDSNYSDDSVCMYIRPDNAGPIRYETVMEYSDIKTGIGKIIEMIYNNEICYRSLFPTSYEKIMYSDIVNICAAFECQYAIRYQKNYKVQAQEKIKSKILSLVEQNKSSIMENDEEAYNEVIGGIKHINETLKNRIQDALNALVDVYGEQKVRLRFIDDFDKMPERIKNSRNYLDHGRLTGIFTKKSFLDAELLRAVVYMMIIESAGITEKDCIIRVIDKVANNL